MMNIKKKIIDINTAINNSIENQLMQDILSLELIKRIYELGTFIPITEKTLRPFCLAFMLNEITINKRVSILEFGSGLSTILVGRLLKSENIKGKIVSVEHDEKWVEYLNEIIRKEQMDDVINIIHAPLEQKTKKGGYEFNWYDTKMIDAKTKDTFFDMLIIDGPPAFQEDKILSRYPALPYISERLNNNHVIFIDDVHRKGETLTKNYYEEEYNMKFRVYGKTLGVYYKGDHFISNPLNIMPS